MAFRAWNRGLAAVIGGSGGVYLFNGTDWFPDPSFPGTSTCPGSTVLWAGKLDYWLIGSSQGTLGSGASPSRTLCRFDGVSLVWEPLPLPAATVARLPSAGGVPQGGITAGACFAWDNCWFFGTDGIKVHWDGQTLSDASSGLGTSPWLQGDFTSAIARADPNGNPFALAVTKSTSRQTGNPTQLPPEPPNNSSPPQVFGSDGGPFSPLPFSPPAAPQQGAPYPWTTDIVAIDSDNQGNVWLAGDPTTALGSPPISGPAPLLRLNSSGAAVTCPGNDPGTFSYNSTAQTPSYQWSSVSVFPNDGSVLASALYQNNNVVVGSGADAVTDREPVLVHAVCGQPPTVTQFRAPDPFNGPGAPPIPADYGTASYASVVAAVAANDAWAFVLGGTWTSDPQGDQVQNQGSHLYQWTDGQAPSAPAGDDNEPRPSLFTLDAPVYVLPPPTVVIGPSSSTTIQQPGRRKTVKPKPAIYGVKTKLAPSRNGTFTLYISFRLRRPITIGIEALRGKKVVASSGMKHLTGSTGRLALTLVRSKWPTALRFVSPK